DPNGATLTDDIWASGYDWRSGGYGGFVPGVYTLQFIPQGVPSESFKLRFHNDNGHFLRVLANGTSFTSSIGDYQGDYDKFQVDLTSGQTLQIAGPSISADLSIFNSK